MKNRLLFILTTSTLLFACNNHALEKEEEQPQIGNQLNPEAKLSITAKLKETRGMSYNDSLSYIVKYAWEWYAISKENNNAPTARGFDFDDDYGTQRDTINNKFLLWGVDIIQEDGSLGWFITSLSDFVIITLRTPNSSPANPRNYHGTLDLPHDTIAYVPNKIFQEARDKIMSAYERKNYQECYRLFDSAFIFIPTTGEKWRAMKASGIE